MLLARDIMNQNPVRVPPGMTVGELVDMLQRLNVSAAVVCAPDRRLVGIVTQEDVLFGTMGSVREPERPRRLRSADGLLQSIDPEPADLEGADLWRHPVSDIMTESVIAVAPDTPVVEVCQLLWSLRIHHLPVVEGGRAVGMISSLDLCRAVAEGKVQP